MIDWSKAPEGATHYSAEDENHHQAWWKKEGDEMLCICEDGDIFTWVKGYRDETVRLIPRPAETYMPQVGEVCEYDSKGSAKIEIFDFDFGKHCIVDLWADGDQIEVIAHSEQCGNFVLVVKNKTAKMNNFSAILPEYVRPLKTEREKFVERWVNLKRVHLWPIDELLGAIFDEGARFND